MRTSRRLALMMAGTIGLCVSPAWSIEQARIESASGAPRIMIDGSPARARIFWGQPGARPLSAAPAGDALSFEFSASEDGLSQGTMHFRFGQQPGDVWLDDLRVVDVASGEEVLPLADFSSGQAGFENSWRVWPLGGQNTVGQARVEPTGGRQDSPALHISLHAPPDKHWPDYHIYHTPTLSLQKGHRYRATLWAKASPARNLSIGFYRPGSPFVELGGPEGVFEQQIKLAADAGINIVSFPVNLPWPKPGETSNWSSVDTACQRVLNANPRALLLPRVASDAPPWWLGAHADDQMRWDDGPHKNPHATPASADYRRAAAAGLDELVRHVETTFGPHVLGYHPCGQNTGEWFYEDTWKQGLNGYAPVELRAWRAWLRERYHGNAALAGAWRDAAATLDAAQIPSPAARRAAPAGLLRDPAGERALIDFAEFQQRMMADCVCQLAHAVRTATAGKKLVVFFYGYHYEFGVVAHGPATSGHYALRRVLDCPDIDVLCSPISYFDRGLGGGAPSMTSAESVALAGKLWLDEDDTHTYLATGEPPGSADHVDTVEKSSEELARNVAQCALRNFGCWWMDLGASGWFNDPRLWKLMSRLEPLDRALLERPTPFRPEVAAVVGEQSMLCAAAGKQLATGPAVHDARRSLGRMGAPYGQYLLDDVTAGRVHAKLYAFLAAWRFEPDERRRVLAATRGATKIWLYAPGYLSDQGASVAGMRELTGFTVKRLDAGRGKVTPTPAGRELGLTNGFGTEARIDPIFAVADATPEEIMATYADGSAAVARRKTSDGVSWFIGAPGITSELLRCAAHDAGVHLYVERDCNVYANGPFLALHGSATGSLEIDSGRDAPARDLLTGQTVGQGPRFTLPLERGQTRILQIGEPAP